MKSKPQDSIFATNPLLAQYQLIDKKDLGVLFTISPEKLDPLIESCIIQKREVFTKGKVKTSRDVYPLKAALDVWNKIFVDPEYPNNFENIDQRKIVLSIWNNSNKLKNDAFKELDKKL